MVFCEIFLKKFNARAKTPHFTKPPVVRSIFNSRTNLTQLNSGREVENQGRQIKKDRYFV
jgi:hypothetical protein